MDSYLRKFAAGTVPAVPGHELSCETRGGASKLGCC